MTATTVTIGLILIVAALFLIEKKFPFAVNRFEENVISILLATITLIAFTQVIARYGFAASWGGALELQRVLFAWLILFGMSYGLKQSMHLGVDAAINLLPQKAFKSAALFGAFCCILYAVILLYAGWLSVFGAETRGGAIDYWVRFYKVGIGLDDLRYPEWFQEMFGVQERVHRWVAYIMLPVGLALFAFRALQGFFDILTGKRHTMIASHETEELVAENKDILKD